MKIQEGKFVKESLSDLQNYAVADFLVNTENLTSIKDGGVLDCIFSMTAGIESEIQDLTEYLVRQSNPEYVEGIWQDILYERLGVKRIPPAKASFVIALSGAPNTAIDKDTILIRDEFFNIEYKNNYDFCFDNDGNARVTFCSVDYGEFSITENSELKIVRAPSGVVSLDNLAISDVVSGRNKESDDDYRTRFRNSKALNAKATQKANLANLSKYVDNSSFLNILDKNTDLSMPVGEVEIVAKHNTTDRIFAEAIFDTFGAGVKYTGDVSVTLNDLNNQNVTVKFHEAQDVPICIKATLLIDNSVQEVSVFQNIKTEILAYAKKQGFGLESTIYATEFIVPILGVEGVNAVTEIKVKRVSDVNYFDILTLTYDEIPDFAETNIY